MRDPIEPGRDLFREHFENIPGAAFIWRREDRDFRIIAHNRAAASFGDSNVGQIIGRTASELAEFNPEMHKLLADCADTGQIVQREGDLVFTDGRVRRIVDTFVPLADGMVVVHGDDITDRREMEQRLRESEARMRALLEAIPDTVMRMDVDALIKDVRYPKALAPTPWRPEDLVGKAVRDFYGPEAHAVQSRINREAIRTGETQAFEVSIPGPGGAVYLESRVVAIDDRDVVVISRDISDRVKLERQQVLIEQRARNRLSREIHDGIAQNLIGAKLHLEVLERRLSDEASAHAEELRSVRELIGQVVSEARSLSHSLSPVPEDMSLFAALAQAAKHVLNHLNVACECACSGSDARIGPATVSHLYRIAQEAATNAARHGRATAIALDCRIANGELVLTVADNGNGRPDELEERDGIGMRIMRYRARALGGRIEYRSAPGGGLIMRCPCVLPATALTEP
jgi:PAS domain S-box-containing protein